jgi:predicted amidohydrolase
VPTEGTYALLTGPELPEAPKTGAEKPRTARVAVVEHEPDFERLIEKLNRCGRQDCDLVCLWEYVWYRSDEEVEQFRDRNAQRLRRIAAAAAEHRMYVVIGGELERGFNEAIVFDRSGKELGRYTKINQTTSPDSRYYRKGEQVGIFDLDFGRICVKICADVYSPEIDRVAALHRVDLMLLPTQDAGPYTEHTRLRDARRCVDDGYFLLRASSQTRQTDHRAYIMDPWAVRLASSQYRTNNQPLIVSLQLDNRPGWYTWPEPVRASGPYPDPYQSGKQPERQGDLREAILENRRPDLYRPAAP